MHQCTCGLTPSAKLVLETRLERNVLRCVETPCSYEEVLGLTLEILEELRDLGNEVYVMFSGGRDSLVLLDLSRKVLRDVRAVYVEVTGNTHEKNREYVYRIVKMLGIELIHLKRNEYEFYERVCKWGWPGPGRRWCMTEFKRKPIESFFRCRSPAAMVLVGVKAWDSPRRRKYIINDGVAYRSSWGTVVVRPILHWTREHVITYIKEVGLHDNPLYAELGESGNCVYCPFIMDGRYYLNLRIRYPEWYRKIEAVEKIVRNGTPFVSGPRRFTLNQLIQRSFSGSSTTSC